MPALAIKGNGLGWHKNIRAWGSRAFETYDTDEVAMMAAAVVEDEENCKSCEGGTPVPHMTGYADLAHGKAFTYHCQSFSRWYNPETKAMEGRSHCTCDYCF